MKKIRLTWQDVEKSTSEICRQIQKTLWQPDYIVGLTRGGLVPAVMLSQYLEVPMHALKVSLRDSGSDCESNLWMQGDAVEGKKILIVDDINDSGATLNWIHEDWGPEVEWGRNVRVAVLYDNESSDSIHTPDYSAESINKAADPQWIVFPWENWW